MALAGSARALWSLSTPYRPIAPLFHRAADLMFLYRTPVYPGSLSLKYLAYGLNVLILNNLSPVSGYRFPAARQLGFVFCIPCNRQPVTCNGILYYPGTGHRQPA